MRFLYYRIEISQFRTSDMECFKISYQLYEIINYGIKLEQFKSMNVISMNLLNILSTQLHETAELFAAKLVQRKITK